tara:strand:- start:1130 stop:3637 length:2508 start_codon:yes stop_codon:yes gene_type:complete
MAAIIWEAKENYISPYIPFKIRIRRIDNSDISGDDEGDLLYESVEGTNNLKLGVGSGTTNVSLGFGYENFNWEEFWSAAEQKDSDNWKNLGNGVGATKEILPYRTGLGGFDYLTNVEWEVFPKSIIATVPLNIFNTTPNGENIIAQHPYHPNNYQISDNTYQQNLNYFNSLQIESQPNFWGQPEDSSINFGGATIPLDVIENLNVAVSLKINLYNNTGQGNLLNTTEFLNKDICCADVSTIEELNSYWVYAPIKYELFTENQDFLVSVDNVLFLSGNEIGEGGTTFGMVHLNSNNYSGDIEIFLVSKENQDTVNSIIGEDLDWYGGLTEDVVAQYGTLQSVNTNDVLGIEADYGYSNPTIFGATTYINKDNVNFLGHSKTIFFSYTAGSEFAGQTDNFAIFIRFNNPNFEEYDDPNGTEEQWSLVSYNNKWSYVDTLAISIIDSFDVEGMGYNPSDTLIEKPSDIIYHLMESELGYNKNVNQESLSLSRQQHQNYKLGFSVNKPIQSKSLIQEIMQSSKSFASLSNNILKFITINNTYTGEEKIKTIDSDDVINYKFSRTALQDVKTQVEIKYNYDYGTEKFNNSTGLIKINEDYLDGMYFKTGTYKQFLDGNLKDINYYGIKTDEISQKIDHIDTFLTYESKYIRDEYTAQELAKHLLFLNCNQHNIVELTLPLKYFDLEIGDTIDFNKMILGRKIYNEKYVLNSTGDMPIRCGQFILPLFMVTQTNKTLNNIKLKAIQLHHMDEHQLVYDQEIYTLVENTQNENGVETSTLKGDVGLNGRVDVGDIVLTVNHILGDSILTGQALQNADMNDDGDIRVNDIVLLVNKILGIENE